MTALNIELLNQELRSSNEMAFKKLFSITYPRLIGYANLFMHDNELARDIVQDTFILFWEKRKNLKDYPPAERLLFIMLKNNCLRYIRDNKFFQSTVSIDQNNIDSIEGLQLLFEFDFLDQEGGIEDYFWVSLLKQLNNLPEKRKEVFIQCKINGHTQQDVALELGISVKAVEKHLSLAKKQLQVLLSEIPYQF